MFPVLPLHDKHKTEALLLVCVFHICAASHEQEVTNDGLREDESLDGSETRGISGATQSGSQRVSQARIYSGLEVSECGSERTDGSLGEVAVMKTPTIFQWYQILRRHYQFTVFQAVRSALWLARVS
jgi:hypothetical protein